MASRFLNLDDRLSVVSMYGIKLPRQGETVRVSDLGKFGVSGRVQRYKNEQGRRTLVQYVTIDLSQLTPLYEGIRTWPSSAVSRY